MKLDIDYIKEILTKIENIDSDRVRLGELMKSFDIKDDENEKFSKLYLHLRILYDEGFLETTSNSFPIEEGANEHTNYNSGAKIRITLNGYRLLDSLRSDKLSVKIKDTLKNIGIESLKQIPALAIKLLS